MDSYHEAHFFSSPNQGNVYTYATVSLRDNSVICLYSPMADKVYTYGFETGDFGRQLPYWLEVPFANIDMGSEIVAIDALNRSYLRDEIHIAIAIKRNTCHPTSSHVINIYSKPKDDHGPFDLSAAAKNVSIIELHFGTYHLTHALAISDLYEKEMVFMLTGDDRQVRLYNYDGISKLFSEESPEKAFPEIIYEDAVILWLDIKYTRDFYKRISALGCADGSLRLLICHARTGSIMTRCCETYEGPITRVILFKGVPEYGDIPEAQRVGVNLIPIPDRTPDEHFHLFVGNSNSTSSVRMDILQSGLFLKKVLPKSNTFDSVLSACACDFDCDRSLELFIGTFSSVIFVYKYVNQEWKLIGRDRMAHAVQWIGFEALTHDGLKDIIIATVAGIHVYQPIAEKALDVFCKRYAILMQRYKNRHVN